MIYLLWTGTPHPQADTCVQRGGHRSSSAARARVRGAPRREASGSALRRRPPRGLAPRSSALHGPCGRGDSGFAYRAAQPAIETVPLPAYAPELNPDERVWGHVTYGRLATYAPADMARLRRTVVAELSGGRRRKRGHGALRRAVTLRRRSPDAEGMGRSEHSARCPCTGSEARHGHAYAQALDISWEKEMAEVHGNRTHQRTCSARPPGLKPGRATRALGTSSWMDGERPGGHHDAL